MGMYDHIIYQDKVYQTKDTPAQAIDNYKIEQDQDSGHWYLWHEEYDAEWDDTVGLFGGSLKQTNFRWVCCHNFDGNIRFYRSEGTGWIEYRSLFMDGKMLKIKEIFDEALTNWYKAGVEEKGLE